MTTPDDPLLPRPPRFARLRAFWQRRRGWILGFALLFGALLLGASWWLLRELPSLNELDNLQPKVPLRVFSEDGVLIGEFGKERRSLVKLADMPADLKQAVLAIEDARFYEHGAVDVLGVLRAGAANLGSGGRGQGASTITMQLARDLFLTKDKTITRKLREIIVAYKIEAVRSKDEILELYMNQIYLGQRAYGFASAARVYFGKELRDISLAEAAMLAGLPKAPAAYNPVVNPKRARIRQAYILKRMRELGYINAAREAEALAEPLKLALGTSATPTASPRAEYVAEMVRQQMFAQYGDATYAKGLVVTTTLNYATQLLAWQAVRDSLFDYDRRRDYRGPEGYVALPAGRSEREDAIEEALERHPDADELPAAVVLKASSREVQAMSRDGEIHTISGNGLRFAARSLRSDASTALRLRPGSIIRLAFPNEKKPEISQLPDVQGAIIALSPQDGAIKALVGGFDFKVNNFNRVTQAVRQPGSTFKPFVYSAALEKGVGPATLVNDAPFSIKLDPERDEVWEPKNDDLVSSGPVTLRVGLKKSKNQVAVRVLQHIGVPFARDYITRFGFEKKQMPPYLPLALGAGNTTPLQLAEGYAVFANGGYKVAPYLIREVRDGNGKLLMQAKAPQAEQDAPQVLTPRNAYVMHSLLKSVAQNGTAYQSNELGRTDIGGKTGTTNQARDAWFAGYQRSLVAISWMGFDQPRSLGNSGAGAQLALPQWMRFMRPALKDVPAYEMPEPAGVVRIGGELYFDTAQPGQGFVSGIDMQNAVWPKPEAEETPTEDEMGESGAAEAESSETPPGEAEPSGSNDDLFPQKRDR
ncbi:penicillin-binding protein 1A [Chitinimonas taiwanensis]|uniref:Penicillin-binding protein 1A n=1 Tax=Chitinimonas taiwanensis DSM 18899 TaxID=1121279 RepID=A0A1K2HF20_9NEIS|nr:PBP1A family penicillin-binding protein [Chitinimonas taiwanensis]SFZ75347.1 penicillin-binding protein 1A [Chitinimonas taiwanensis DSM 18899]